MNRAPPHCARDVQIGQEVHLDLCHPLALARLTTPSFDVEAEPAGTKPALFGVACGREHLADLVEYPGVRGRVAARRATDRGLINLNHLVDLPDAAQAFVRARFGRDPAESPDHGPR